MSIDRAALIAAATAVMVREGGRLAEWHSWRCQYPEVYGQCNCNDGAADEIIRELLPLIADAIEALDSDWHFRGPGDPGILVVSQAAAVELVRSLGGNDGSSDA